MQTVADRVKRVRRKLGETQARFASRFDVDQSTISKWERGSQQPDPHHVDVIASLEVEDNANELAPSAEQGKALLFTLVPIVGLVGAGAEIQRVDAEPASRIIGTTKAPRGFGAVEAIEVRGDSMYPAYRSGDVIFLASAPVPLPIRGGGDEYAVTLADGRQFLKIVEPRSGGRYDLEAYNGPPIRDVEIVEAHKVRYVRRR